MSAPEVGVEIREESDDFLPRLEIELTRALRSTLEQAMNESILLSARVDGAVVGGLSAGTSYGWLLIKMLWVVDGHRRRGIGRRLVERTEAAARKLGCHGAWLDTSNPSAMRFYESLGFEVFGQLSNPPDGPVAEHRRFFMRKSL